MSLNKYLSIYFRTTTYDSKSGGFVTSVSTDKNTHDDDVNCENSENQRHELGEDGEKLVLTQDTYNTLKRSEKKTVSFKSNNNTMKRKMSRDDLKSKNISNISSYPILIQFTYFW